MWLAVLVIADMLSDAVSIPGWLYALLAFGFVGWGIYELWD